LALVDGGGAGDAIVREEAVLLAAYAQFDQQNPGRAEIDELQAALEAYAPTEAIGRRIGWNAWYSVLDARHDREQWRPAYELAERLTLEIGEDSGASPALRGAIAAIGVVAAHELDEPQDALILAHRGMAAFPPQPIGQPIDPMLGILIGWDAGLHNLLRQREETLDEQEHPEPPWNAERYPTAMGCAVEWIERPPPRYPPAAAGRGQILGMLFEYYLDADGSVIRVDPVGTVEESVGFADAVVAAMQDWRATPQPRAECRGPWPLVFEFLLEN
jgi:hypothetical protein